MKEKSLKIGYISKEVRRLTSHFYVSYREYILFIVGLIIGLVVCGYFLDGFFELLDALYDKELADLDDTVTSVVWSWRSDWLTTFLIYLTKFGDRASYVTLCIILGIYFYIRKGNLVFALQTTFVLVIASLVNRLLKGLIERARPNGEHLVEVTSLSFPSGHAMSSIAFYGFLIYLVWYLGNHKVKKIFLTIFLSLMILGIGLSRIYLGVHYPSDVLAGYAAGGVCLIVFILAFSVIRFIHRRKRRVKE